MNGSRWHLNLSFVVLLASSPALPGVLDCALGTAKVSMLRELKLPPTASFEEIRVAFEKLNKVLPDRSITVDARRLINEEDWNKAVASGNKTPWLAYGEKTIYDWEAASKFVNNLDPNKSVTVTLLKEIHLEATKSLPFHGFEGRRLRLKHEKGILDKERFKEGLALAYKQDRPVHGVPHEELRGVFRSSNYDNIVHTGSSFDKDGNRFFTKAEKDAMIDNPFIGATERTFTKVGDDLFKGKVIYLNPQKVALAVNEILLRTEMDLAKTKKLSEKVAVIQQMKKDLISVHPFLDGNGRTIRLMEDLVLRRYGLPPSLFPNESDILMSAAEAAEFTREHMIKYLNEHTDYAIKATRP